MLNIRRIIYKLKQQFGSPIDIYVEGKSELNTETGRISTPKSKYHIKKAVVLPQISQYSNPLATAIAKLSGTMIVATRTIIVDANDLKFKNQEIIPEENNYIDYNGDRYQITQVEQLDRKVGTRERIFGYQIIAKEAEEETSAFIFDQIINDRLVFAQRFPYIYFQYLNVEFNDGLPFVDEFIWTPKDLNDITQEFTFTDSFVCSLIILNIIHDTFHHELVFSDSYIIS